MSVLIDRGDAHYFEKAYDRAVQDYDQAVKLRPDYRAFMSRGAAHEHQGRYDLAIRDFDDAIKLDPNPWAFDDRGRAYQESGAFDRAIEDYDQAIKLQPNYSTAFNDRCWTRAIANKELDAALADCNESLRLRPNISATLDSRALVWLRMQRNDEAIRDADASLSGDSKHASSLFTRGVAKRRRGDISAGDSDLAAARAIDPDIDKTFSRYGVRP